METKTKLLIAIGAAVTANCQPCLKTLMKKAHENGLDKKEIAEAIGVAKIVRKNSLTQIDRFISSIVDNPEAELITEGTCNCS